MRWWATALLFFQFAQDPIRQHELRERALRSKIEAADHEAAAQATRERQLFSQRFNVLVAAVESFAKEYNQSKGHVWPKKQADDLRAAMQQLQRIEPTLRPTRSK